MNRQDVQAHPTNDAVDHEAQVPHPGSRCHEPQEQKPHCSHGAPPAISGRYPAQGFTPWPA